MPANAHAVQSLPPGSLQRHESVAALIAAERPHLPVYALYPEAFRQVAKSFMDGFPGETMYAVKANHALPVIDCVHDAGITHFDVASLAEVRLVSERYPKAARSYMSPIRIRGSAGEAYHRYGVTDFAYDSDDELATILAETGAASDPAVARRLTLYVRLYVPADGSLLELSSKFGVAVSAAARLMKKSADAGVQAGLTFHVGSQCLHPGSYRTALRRCGEVLHQSGVRLAALDVGGGFPGYYNNVTVPPLSEFFDAVRDGLTELRQPPGCRVYCEPGRALVADGLSVVTQVSLRRDHTIYINDGIYGSLNEYALKNWPVRYPMTVHAEAPDGTIRQKTARLAPFKVYGPTCDSLDVLNYLIDLPETIAAGDWIEFRKIGAYSCSLRTAFNGFYPDRFVEITG